MLTRLSSVLCCAIFLGSSAHAQVSLSTGNDLLRYCAHADATLTGHGMPSGDTQEAVGEGLCMGIIAGIRYVVTSSIMDPKYRLCIPDNVSTGQALSVVVNYMRNHPEALMPTFFINIMPLQTQVDCAAEISAKLDAYIEENPHMIPTQVVVHGPR